MEETNILPISDGMVYLSKDGFFQRFLILPKTPRTILFEREEEIYFDAGEKKNFKFKDYKIDFEIKIEDLNISLGTEFESLDSLKQSINGYIILK